MHVVLPELFIIGVLMGGIWAYQTPISRSAKSMRPTVRPSHSNSDNDIQMMQKDAVGSKMSHPQLDCTRFCTSDGLCDSAEFYRCINANKDRFGAIGKHRTAFIPGGRRVDYDWSQANW